jgi:dTDP-4-dehydrorhamnose reductase
VILLLGASGYIGQAFARELRARSDRFVPLTRKAIDYTKFELLFDYMRRMKPTFVINAAGLTGLPNVDACEIAREATLAANTLLPQTIARACMMTNTPWGHVSSGSIYSGAVISRNGRKQVEKNLNDPDTRRIIAEQPENVYGFTEWDEPNFSFRHSPSSFYSGSKALAEETIHNVGESYIWRPGIPFNRHEEHRNFLWRIQQYPRVHDSISSLSHVGDFVRACLNLYEKQAPYGIYNVINPGIITTRQVVDMIQTILRPNRSFEFWKDDEEFYRYGAKTPRSNCILDITKLQGAGVEMRPVSEALEDSLHTWDGAIPVPEALSIK